MVAAGVVSQYRREGCGCTGTAVPSGSGAGCVLSRVMLHTARDSGFDTEPEGRCENTKGRIEASAGLSGATLSACSELGCGSRVGRDGMQGAPGLSGAPR